MTDFLRVPPRVDGLQAAMATARRRRLRTASVTTSLGASLALAVPLLLGNGGQAAVLMPEPDVQQPAVTTSDQPTVKVPSHVVAAGPHSTFSTGTAGAPDVAVPHVSRRGTTRGPVSDRGSVPAPAGRSPLRSAGSYTSGPITRTDGGIYSPDPTDTADDETSCAYYDGHTNDTGLCKRLALSPADKPHQWLVAALLCNGAAMPADVTFDQKDEIDLVLMSKQDEVWRWSSSHPARPIRHTVHVDGGTCARWDFVWTGVDGSGRTLKAGTYTMRLYVHTRSKTGAAVTADVTTG